MTPVVSDLRAGLQTLLLAGLISLPALVARAQTSTNVPEVLMTGIQRAGANFYVGVAVNNTNTLQGLRVTSADLQAKRTVDGAWQTLRANVMTNVFFPSATSASTDLKVVGVDPTQFYRLKVNSVAATSLVGLQSIPKGAAGSFTVTQTPPGEAPIVWTFKPIAARQETREKSVLEGRLNFGARIQLEGGLFLAELQSVPEESRQAFSRLLGLTPGRDERYVLIGTDQAPVLLGRLSEQDKTLGEALLVTQLNNHIQAKVPVVSVGDQGVAPSMLVLDAIAFSGYNAEVENALTLGLVYHFSREVKFNFHSNPGIGQLSIDGEDDSNLHVSLLEPAQGGARQETRVMPMTPTNKRLALAGLMFALSSFAAVGQVNSDTVQLYLNQFYQSKSSFRVDGIAGFGANVTNVVRVFVAGTTNVSDWSNAYNVVTVYEGPVAAGGQWFTIQTGFSARPGVTAESYRLATMAVPPVAGKTQLSPAAAPAASVPGGATPPTLVLPEGMSAPVLASAVDQLRIHLRDMGIAGNVHASYNKETNEAEFRVSDNTTPVFVVGAKQVIGFAILGEDVFVGHMRTDNGQPEIIKLPPNLDLTKWTLGTNQVPAENVVDLTKISPELKGIPWVQQIVSATRFETRKQSATTIYVGAVFLSVSKEVRPGDKTLVVSNVNISSVYGDLGSEIGNLRKLANAGVLDFRRPADESPDDTLVVIKAMSVTPKFVGDFRYPTAESSKRLPELLRAVDLTSRAAPVPAVEGMLRAGTISTPALPLSFPAIAPRQSEVVSKIEIPAMAGTIELSRGEWEQAAVYLTDVKVGALPGVGNRALDIINSGYLPGPGTVFGALQSIARDNALKQAAPEIVEKLQRLLESVRARNELELAAQRTAAKSPEIAGQVQPVRILVVDDEEPMRRLSSQILGRMGFIAKPVSSGEEALKILETESFDVVQTDFNMGSGMQGPDLIRRVQELKPGTKFVLMTGEKADGVKRAVADLNHGYLDGNSVAYVAKPNVVAPLRNILKNWFPRSELRSTVADQQAFEKDVVNLLAPEVKAWLEQNRPKFGTNALADVLSGIVLSMDASQLGTQSAVDSAVALLTAFVMAHRKGEFDFQAYSNAVQDVVRANTVFSTSNAEGRIIRDLPVTPDSGWFANLALRLATNTGQREHLVFDVAGIGNARERIEAILSSVRNTGAADGQKIGNRLTESFVHNVAKEMAVVASRMTKVSENVYPVLYTENASLREILIKRADKLFVTITFGENNKTAEDSALGPMRDWAAMKLSQQKPKGNIATAADMSEILGELLKELPGVFTARNGYLNIENSALAGLARILSEQLLTRAATAKSA